MRIALGLEYDGAAYHGWQTQLGVRAIQPTVEAALTQVADHPVQVHCAGRTDTGVHALYQVVHFDTAAVRTMRSWILGANVNLPPDVAVLWARPVPDAFHARFSARSRAYDYVICNRRTRPGLWRDKVSWECRPLDAVAMAEAARHWLGEHDFSSFRAQGCQSRHPRRTVLRCDVRAADQFIVLQVEANAFLQHMVRNFAGVLMEIGRGQHKPQWAAEVLAQRDRTCAGITAPAQGLYLTAVRYAPEFELPPPPLASPAFACYTGPDFD